MWTDFAPATCLPDHCFCEAVGDGIIRQPANTWSNVGFCVAAALMLVELRRRPASRGLTPLEAGLFVLATFLVGVTSGVFHASLTFVGQTLDVQSMYLVALLAFAVNADGLRPGKPKRFLFLYLGLNLVLGVLLVTVPALRRWAFGVAVGAVVLTEVLLRRRALRAWALGPLGGAAAVQAVAFGIWTLDTTRLLCAPHSLVQGHAVWHLLSAAAVWLLWRYFRGPVEAVAAAPLPAAST